MTYSFGWRRQKPDSRDIHYDIPRRITRRLANHGDLSAGMGELLDQGELGSCGPNTVDECIEYDERLQSLTVESASRLYIYYNARLAMGQQYVSQDSGVSNREMMKALHQYGYCSESLWPYDTSKLTQQPPMECYDAAQTIDNYAAVEKSHDQMQGTLSLGHLFVFGFDCYDQIQSEQAAMTGIVADPPAGATPVGGHDVSFCGWNATGSDLPGVMPGNRWPKNTYKFRNHWRRSPTEWWGDGGYGYIGFDYAVSAHADDFWVINALPTGTVPPNPDPAPPNPSPPLCGGLLGKGRICRRDSSAARFAFKLQKAANEEFNSPGDYCAQLVALLTAMCGGIPLGNKEQT